MKNTYESPLSSRYCDKEMKYIFSPDMKFRTGESYGLHLLKPKWSLAYRLHRSK